MSMTTVVVVPALDEGGNIAALVHAALRQPVAAVVVVDNGSVDDTAARARDVGGPASRRFPSCRQVCLWVRRRR